MPVRDAKEALIGWLIVLRDVTQEQELSEARDQLAEMIVHDLRSPLTAILGSLKLLESVVAKEEHSPIADQALSVSNRSVQQMLGLVNSLLDLAKLESGELELSLAPLSLTDLCSELLDTYVQEANELGIILEQSLEPGLPEIEGDRDKIERVLSNLIDNALKFTPAGGHVSLEVSQAGDRLRVSVGDSGPGVPVEFRVQIFERFRQIPGLAGRRRGTGLGLAFAKLAVEAHGGQIHVEDRPGGGSVFSFSLPLSPP
jgi:signal transduction histidine kinase